MGAVKQTIEAGKGALLAWRHLPYEAGEVEDAAYDAGRALLRLASRIGWLLWVLVLPSLFLLAPLWAWMIVLADRQQARREADFQSRHRPRHQFAADHDE